MTRKTVIDFYTTIVDNNKEAGFSAVLQETLALPSDAKRTIESEHGHIRLDEAVQDSSGIWTGDLVRIRMDNLPVKASIKGSKNDLGLLADEGLGEETAFLYDQASGVLVLQRNRLGVSMPRFSDYFSRVLDWQPIVSLLPIISGDALQRLHDISEHRRIEMRVQAPNGAGFLRDSHCAVAGVAGIMDEMGATSVSITIGVSHGKRSLNKKRLIETVKALIPFTEKGSAVRSLKMTGRDAEDEIVPLDFIKDRIFFETELTSGANRRISYDERKRAVRLAWATKKQEVLDILASE